jgi:hypothetical protein
VVHQIKTIKLVELNFNFKENALFERKSKAKNNFCLPLTLIMQKRDHFRHLRHHYSESPVIPLSNDIWYRCVAHGFITFYFLIFYRWSICYCSYLNSESEKQIHLCRTIGLSDYNYASDKITLKTCSCVNRSYSAILATLQITSYVHSRNSS